MRLIHLFKKQKEWSLIKLILLVPSTWSRSLYLSLPVCCYTYTTKLQIIYLECSETLWLCATFWVMFFYDTWNDEIMRTLNDLMMRRWMKICLPTGLTWQVVSWVRTVAAVLWAVEQMEQVLLHASLVSVSSLWMCFILHWSWRRFTTLDCQGCEASKQTTLVHQINKHKGT